MKVIVTPGPNGLISAAGQIIGQALPDEAIVVSVESLDIPPMSAAVVTDGKVEIVANWLGSGPWFDQNASTADRLTPIEITEYGVNPELLGWKMEPRPETAAEKKAREKAEAEAIAAKEADRVKALVATSVQFAQAAAVAGIITRDEAIAWASAGTLPAVLAEAIAAIPDEAVRFAAEIKASGAVQYERASPIVSALGAALGKADEDLDALFKLAVTL